MVLYMIRYEKEKKQTALTNVIHRQRMHNLIKKFVLLDVSYASQHTSPEVNGYNCYKHLIKRGTGDKIIDN